MKVLHITESGRRFRILAIVRSCMMIRQLDQDANRRVGLERAVRLGQFPSWCIQNFPKECHGDRSEAEWSHLLFWQTEQKVAHYNSPRLCQATPAEEPASTVIGRAGPIFAYYRTFRTRFFVSGRLKKRYFGSTR